MNTETMAIRGGMEVYGSDGTRLGQVQRIWRDQLVAGETEGSGSGYFAVDQTESRGRGAPPLFVPLSAISRVVAGERVILDFSPRHGRLPERTVINQHDW